MIDREELRIDWLCDRFIEACDAGDLDEIQRINDLAAKDPKLMAAIDGVCEALAEEEQGK